VQEFKDLLGGNNVSDDKWEFAIRDVDVNNDGRIDLKEFTSIFRKMLTESMKPFK
jgi:Ca2+-binding EF-hand superfamily protein